MLKQHRCYIFIVFSDVFTAWLSSYWRSYQNTISSTIRDLLPDLLLAIGRPIVSLLLELSTGYCRNYRHPICAKRPTSRGSGFTTALHEVNQC
jgi:hypothetical protein